MERATSAALGRDAHISPTKLHRRKHLDMELLVIDEIGFELLTRQGASFLFRLVSYRYRRASILTTATDGISD